MGRLLPAIVIGISPGSRTGIPGQPKAAKTATARDGFARVTQSERDEPDVAATPWDAAGQDSRPPVPLRPAAAGGLGRTIRGSFACDQKGSDWSRRPTGLAGTPAGRQALLVSDIVRRNPMTGPPPSASSSPALRSCLGPTRVRVDDENIDRRGVEAAGKALRIVRKKLHEEPLGPGCGERGSRCPTRLPDRDNAGISRSLHGSWGRGSIDSLGSESLLSHSRVDRRPLSSSYDTRPNIASWIDSTPPSAARVCPSRRMAFPDGRCSRLQGIR